MQRNRDLWKLRGLRVPAQFRLHRCIVLPEAMRRKSLRQRRLRERDRLWHLRDRKHVSERKLRPNRDLPEWYLWRRRGLPNLSRRLPDAGHAEVLQWCD
jgi:hypothetical protein